MAAYELWGLSISSECSATNPAILYHANLSTTLNGIYGRLAILRLRQVKVGLAYNDILEIQCIRART